MIQDIAPHQFKNEYRPVSPQKDSIACIDEADTDGNRVSNIWRTGTVERRDL